MTGGSEISRAGERTDVLAGRDERAAAVFEPDTLLASQYFDRIRRRVADAPRRLMLAVLEDAVHAYLQYAAARDAEQRDLFREAEEWIEGREPSVLFSFETICHVLDLEPDYLRRGLHAWKERARGTARTIETTRPLVRHGDAVRRASGA
jgi:hypothetical protein